MIQLTIHQVFKDLTLIEYKVFTDKDFGHKAGDIIKATEDGPIKEVHIRSVECTQ